MDKKDEEMLANIVAVISERFQKIEARQVRADELQVEADELIAELRETVDELKALEYMQTTLDSSVWHELGDPASSGVAIERLEKYFRTRAAQNKTPTASN